MNDISTASAKALRTSGRRAGEVATPRFTGFDHVHVYVSSWEHAERWYGTILGLKRVEALMPWAVPGGPLTLEDPTGRVHLALFEREDRSGATAVAFGATGAEFLGWKAHLERRGIELRITDHTLAYSLYFYDPDSNLYEITTYEHAHVREHIDSPGRGQ